MRLRKEVKPRMDSEGLRIPREFLELAGLDGEVQIVVRGRVVEIHEAPDPQEVYREEATGTPWFNSGCVRVSCIRCVRW